MFFRHSEGVEVIFVSDIMKKKPEEATWTFETLRTNITEGEMEIIKFDFMDLQVHTYLFFSSCFLSHTLILLKS